MEMDRNDGLPTEGGTIPKAEKTVRLHDKRHATTTADLQEITGTQSEMEEIAGGTDMGTLSEPATIREAVQDKKKN